MLSRRSLLASTLALAGCGRRKGSGYPGYAFVANEEGGAIAAVDLTAFSVARHIRLGAAPAAVVAHPVRHAVFALTPQTGQVHEIDTTHLRAGRRAQAGRTAVAMRFAPDFQSLWVACASPPQLSRIELETLRQTASVPLPAAPLAFDLSPDGRAAVVSLEGGGVALTGAGGVRVIGKDRQFSRVRFRSDGKHVLAGDIGRRMLLMADAATGGTVVNLPLAVRPDHFCIKQDGGQLFVTGAGMDAVVFVYPYSTEIAETVLAGKAPGAMAECPGPDSDYLLVANPESGEVTILDVDTRRAIAMVGVGQQPSAIALTPDLEYALVLNRLSGDIAVIRIAAISANRAKSAPLFTMIPVGSGPVSVAVRQA